MGAEVIVVVGAAGAVVEVAVSVAFSCCWVQAERVTRSESPRRWMGCMMRPRRDKVRPPESVTR